MKTAEEIALEYRLCHCDEGYTSRKLHSPTCPIHGFGVLDAMEAYAAQFQQPTEARPMKRGKLHTEPTDAIDPIYALVALAMALLVNTLLMI